MNDNLILLDQPKDQAPDALVDLFCGCGGSGGGLLDATEILGRRVQGTFVNHWDKAIAIHRANHPEHRHMEEDLFLLDPTTVFPPGTDCSLMWASPQCTFFSVARGASCVNEQDRSHAHSVTDWVRHLHPEALICENVKEFRSWGRTHHKRRDKSPRKGELIWAKSAKPVRDLPRGWNRRRGESEEDWSVRMIADGYQPYEVPDKRYSGEYFDAWIEEMHELGYESDHRLLRSADYGDPTIRQRLFIYFVRKDTGKKIVWPKPTHDKPDKAGSTGGLRPWRTARQIVDWTLKGTSVFTRRKKLADNTFRRLAIGLVKFGLREFLVSSAHGSPKPEDCARRVHSPDDPLQTLTQKGDRGVVQSEAYILPKDQGHKKDWVKDVDTPVSALTTNHRGEGLAEPSIIQMKGQSTADAPPRSPTSGGQHQALAEAFMMAIDQTGGGRNHGCYDVDEPLRTIVTKNNSACLEFELEEISLEFLQQCGDRGVDTERAETFLSFLVDELKRKGKVDAKPWIYVYYSNGSEGKAIDEPLPAVRTKAGHALVYPVIELDGKLLRIDLFYRMLTPLELQRAMGFPDDMKWGDGTTKTDQIRAIGNSVSRGVARALGLSWYSQEEEIWDKVQHLYES